VTTASDDVALADEVALRALHRCAAALAVAATCLVVLALVFLQLADGRVGARSLPQLVVLGWAAVVALAGTAGCLARARRTLRAAGSGPGQASGAVRLLTLVAVAAPAGGAVLAVGCAAALTPRSESLLSAVLSLAVVVQVALLAVAQRGLLRRAVREPG
jgi:hypothetical protein